MSLLPLGEEESVSSVSGGVGVEMVLLWHSLPCTDFSLLLFAK